MKNLREFESFDKSESIDEATKFTKTASGAMVQVGAKTQQELKVNKKQWADMFARFDQLPSAKKQEVLKKLHSLGLL